VRVHVCLMDTLGGAVEAIFVHLYINQEVIGDGRCFDPGTEKGFDSIAGSLLFVLIPDFTSLKRF